MTRDHALLYLDVQNIIVVKVIVASYLVSYVLL